jgi:hypothetical protein
MPYEYMEALLIRRIAEVRESEASMLRALKSAEPSGGDDELRRGHAQLQQKIGDIERLLAAMESPSLPTAPGFLPATRRRISAYHRAQ